MPVALAAGFYGKLPARGDFVRAGLPRDFIDPWDAWLQLVIAGSRSVMGEAWLPAFLESPVWRFTLPTGMCGSQAVLGLVMPSVDRVGRYFPLSFAALTMRRITPEAGGPWLDVCEAAGRAALEQDTPPQEIATVIGTPDLAVEVTGSAEAVWWTEGSARVNPTRMTSGCLPSAMAYTRMLGAETEGGEVAAAQSMPDRGEEIWESMS